MFLIGFLTDWLSMTDPSEIFYNKGKEFFDQNNLEKAEYFFKNAASQGNVAAMEMMIEHFSHNDDSTIQRYLEEVIELNPKAKYLFKLGNILTKDGVYDKAFEYFRKATLLGDIESPRILFSHLTKFLEFGLLEDDDLLKASLENASDIEDLPYILLMNKNYHTKAIELLKSKDRLDYLFALGSIYKFGIIVEKDEDLSDSYFKVPKTNNPEMYESFQNILQLLENKKCSFSNMEGTIQPFYSCSTCDLLPKINKAVCKSCIEICHKDHKKEFVGFGFGSCDCHEKKCECNK